MLAQENTDKYNVATLAFYNLENLFDTINSVDILNKSNKSIETISFNEAILEGVDFTNNKVFKQLVKEKLFIKLGNNQEYTPNGLKNWDQQKYNTKLNQISLVLSEIGKDLTKSPPLIIGLSEIENKNTLQDLVKTDKLKEYNYNIIHYNSLDNRGIDCALIYQSNRFVVIESKNHVVELIKEGNKEYSRDILYVSGLLDGEKISVFVNHWPSRRSGEKLSEGYRITASNLLNEKIREIKAVNSNEKIILMGDFNDNPIDKSIKLLNSKPNINKINSNDFYNPMEHLFKKGFGTTAYKDNWFLFDQFLISESLINEKNKELYHYHHSGIFDKEFLKTPKGKYMGYPRRSFNGDVFDEGGFSDHFPVYLYLKRKTTD